jgi:predicted nucleic acid-binding protein
VGLILDSSVVIAAERRGETPFQFISEVIHVASDQEAALSSIGLTELVHGIYRATSPERQARGKWFVDELCAGLIVYPYTRETALLAGRIDGEQTARGSIVPFTDLLIGATALSLGFGVLTANVRHFQMIPGLSVVSL